jgi:4-alpha-glucanotransferase
MNLQDPSHSAGETAGASPAEKFYSPFWAIWIVFLTLTILQVPNLTADFKQPPQLQAARTQLKTALVQAQAISQTAEAVGRELLTLSKDSAEAAKIVADFNIKLNEPPPPAK